MTGTVNVILMYNVFRVLGPAIDHASTSRRADLLPTHHNSQSQMQQQFSGMDRASSLHGSTISAKSTMSQYSTLIQSSFAAHQEKMVLSDAVAGPLPPLDRHIIPRAGAKLNSPRSSKPRDTTAQVAHLERDAAEMQGLPPPFRPLRTDPLVTGASGSNRQPIQSLGLSIASDMSPRGCRPALSAIMETLPEETLQQITSPTRPTI
jgi:hypothetical protein